MIIIKAARSGGIMVADFARWFGIWWPIAWLACGLISAAMFWCFLLFWMPGYAGIPRSGSEQSEQFFAVIMLVMLLLSGPMGLPFAPLFAIIFLFFNWLNCGHATYCPL